MKVYILADLEYNGEDFNESPRIVIEGVFQTKIEEVDSTFAAIEAEHSRITEQVRKTTGRWHWPELLGPFEVKEAEQ